MAAVTAARFNMSLGVAAVTYGAGALNMINAVAAAYAEKVSLPALVDRLLERVEGQARPYPVRPQVFPRGMPADAAAITPTDIATAVNDLMAEHGRMPIASDIGDCLFTAMEIEHTALVAPGYYATMGYGVPAGLGLQAATGQRPLILDGDGAFRMTGCRARAILGRDKIIG